MSIKIGIILGSSREGRASNKVGKWVYDNGKREGGVVYEIVDIKSYDLPFYGTSQDTSNVLKWSNKLSEFDAFIFIVPEYNHSISGVLKNALDLTRDPWINKSAGIISYGGSGGARAAEHLRGILSELQVASVRSQVLLTIFDDFDKDRNFTPRDVHLNNLDNLFTQVINWGNALKTLR